MATEEFEGTVKVIGVVVERRIVLLASAKVNVKFEPLVTIDVEFAT